MYLIISHAKKVKGQQSCLHITHAFRNTLSSDPSLMDLCVWKQAQRKTKKHGRPHENENEKQQKRQPPCRPSAVPCRFSPVAETRLPEEKERSQTQAQLNSVKNSFQKSPYVVKLFCFDRWKRGDTPLSRSGCRSASSGSGYPWDHPSASPARRQQPSCLRRRRHHWARDRDPGRGR